MRREAGPHIVRTTVTPDLLRGRSAAPPSPARPARPVQPGDREIGMQTLDMLCTSKSGTPYFTRSHRPLAAKLRFDSFDAGLRR